MRRRAAAASALLAALAGCGEGGGHAAVFEHRPVLREELAAARAEAQRYVAAMVAAQPAPDQELEAERITGLVSMLAYSEPRARELPLVEAETLGDAAVPLLVATMTTPEIAAAERAAACELLAAVDTRLAVDQLAEHLESSPESWLRAHCAWRLSAVGQDRIVPTLIQRLKYEKDPETAIWVADALAAYHNYGGLSALYTIRDGPNSQQWSGAAATKLAELAQRAGVEGPDELWTLWYDGDPERRLPRHEPSPELLLAAWERVDELSGEHFQLRGVDDARFVLVQLGPWVVDVLTAALHDEDVYVRVHSAQCLERMGRRAIEAAPALLAALEDRSLASGAAAALGAVGDPAAEPRLRRALAAGNAHDLRVAAAAALGRLGLGASEPALLARSEDEAEPLDLRQTCATALVAIGAGDRAAELLLACMADEAADRPGAEAALERWLGAREDQAARAAREAWNEHAPPPGTIPSAAQVDERLAARRAVLAERLPELLR